MEGELQWHESQVEVCGLRGAGKAESCREAMSAAPTPRPHAEVIKAWADGALVEFHNPETFKPGQWVLCDFPTWRADCLYRVKAAE